MAKAENAQARRAALMLHALPAQAQQRVMAKLDRSQAARLQLLLDELMRLGVSPSVTRDLQSFTELPAASNSARDATAWARAMALDAATVLNCLKTCSPATVTQLLRAEAWPWKQAVLDGMSEPRRSEVLQLMRGEAPTLSPAALNALCERLCSQAAQLSTGRTAAAQPQAQLQEERGLIARSLRRFKRWMH
jgi:hypothetical protein